MTPLLDNSLAPYFLGALAAMLAVAMVIAVINTIFKRRSK